MSQCKAVSKRSGERCRKHSLKGHNVCSMHGGKSLRGIDAPNFKTGRYSRYLPDRLVQRYQEALADEALMRLDDEIALIDSLLQDQLERLHQDGEEPIAWGQITGLVEQRRKLVEAERKHLADDEKFVAVERLMILMSSLLDIIRRHVASPETRKAIADEVRLLISGVDDPN